MATYQLSGIDLPPTAAGNLVLSTGTTAWASVAMGGDLKISGTGATTIQPGVVTNSKMSGMTQGSVKYGNSSGAASDLPLGTAGQVFLSNGTDAKWTTLSGSVTGITSTGVVSLTPSNIAVVPKTANYTLLQADAFNLFTNTGATGAVTFTLPTTVTVGTQYSFAVTAAQTVSIVAPTNGFLTNTSLVTNIGTTLSFSGGSLYAFLQITAISANTWLLTSRIGGWTLAP